MSVQILDRKLSNHAFKHFLNTSLYVINFWNNVTSFESQFYLNLNFILQFALLQISPIWYWAIRNANTSFANWEVKEPKLNKQTQRNFFC